MQERQPEKKAISACPICGENLVISRLSCSGCDTRIDTTLPVPPFFRLPADLQQFVLLFLRCRGNIREMEKALGISYPTVCRRLELVNELLGNTEPAAPSRDDILTQLERGDISPKQAAQLLNRKKR